MFVVLTLLMTFKSYDSCLSRDNLEPWIVWYEMADDDCKQFTGTYVQSRYDRTEELCVEKRYAMVRRASQTFAEDLLKIMEKYEACDRVTAFVKHQQLEAI